MDKRADIWAFGVVLYEMLTGRRAFEGEDVSLTLQDVDTDGDDDLDDDDEDDDEDDDDDDSDDDDA